MTFAVRRGPVWTPQETARLKQMFFEGKPMADIASALGRTEAATAARVVKHGWMRPRPRGKNRRNGRFGGNSTTFRIDQMAPTQKLMTAREIEAAYRRAGGYNKRLYPPQPAIPEQAEQNEGEGA